MEEIIYPINLDLRTNTHKVLVMKEGDYNSRVIEATITDNGKPFNIENCTVDIKWRKPDGHLVYSESTKINSSTIRVVCTEQMLCVSGISVAEVVITDSNSVVSTLTFNISVNETVASDFDIESSDEFSSLRQIKEHIANNDIHIPEGGTVGQIVVKDENGNVTWGEVAHITSEERSLWNTVSNKANSEHSHNYAGSSSAGGAATTALACTGNAATATKAIQDGNGNVIANTYMPHTTISSTADFNSFMTTGFYHTAFSNGTNQPCSNHGTLFVDFSVGTPYQIYVPDSENTFDYKRIYNKESGTWGTWTKRVFTDNNTTYSAATTSTAGLMSASDKTKLNGIATGANKTSIVANLTTETSGYALDATMGKDLYNYVRMLQTDVIYLKYLTNALTEDFVEAKYIKNHSHSELGSVNVAYMPYEKMTTLTTSNKVIVGFTNGAVGIFSVDVASGNTLGRTITWIRGSVPYVAKATIQSGTNTLALASGSGAYTMYDREIYLSTGENKQTLVFEFSAASSDISVFYKIIDVNDGFNSLTEADTDVLM